MSYLDNLYDFYVIGRKALPRPTGRPSARDSASVLGSLKKGGLRLLSTLEWLDRMTGAAQLTTQVHDIVGGEPGYDPIRSFKQAFTKERKYTADVLSELGWEPETTLGKVGKFGVSFAGDVLADPKSWFTGMKIGGLKGIKFHPPLSKTFIPVTKGTMLPKFAKATGITKGARALAKTKLGKKAIDLFGPPLAGTPKEFQKLLREHRGLSQVQKSELMESLMGLVKKGKPTGTEAQLMSFAKEFYKQPEEVAKWAGRIEPRTLVKVFGKKAAKEMQLAPEGLLGKIKGLRPELKTIVQTDLEGLTEAAWKLEATAGLPIGKKVDGYIRHIYARSPWAQKAFGAGKGIVYGKQPTGRVFETLTEAMAKGWIPETNVFELVRKGGFGAIGRTTNKQLIDNTLAKFGTRLSYKGKSLVDDTGKVITEIKEGFGLYRPKGAVRFFPIKGKPVSIGKGEELVTGLEKIAGKDLVGVTKRVPTYVLPEPIAEKLNNFYQAFARPSEMRKLIGPWKAWVTSGRIAFLSRNFYSINAPLFGQGAMGWGLDYFKELGNSAKALRGTKGFTKIAGKEVPYDEILKQARKWQVVGKHFVRTELGADAFSALTKTGKLNKLNPFNVHNYWLETGAKIGTAEENWGRLAGFLAEAKRNGGNWHDAAQVANKHFINYHEVPKAVQWARERYIPFITWMYQNTALQMELIMREPGMFTAASKLQQNIERLSEPGELAQYAPDWLRKRFSVRLPGDKFLNLDFPMGDLMIEPKNLLAGLNPLLKAPIELALNRELFTGREIDYAQGEGAYKRAPFWTAPFTKVRSKEGQPMVPAKVEYFLRQIPPLQTIGKAVPAVTTGGNINDLVNVLAGIRISPARKYWKTSTLWDASRTLQNKKRALKSQQQGQLTPDQIQYFKELGRIVNQKLKEVKK